MRLPHDDRVEWSQPSAGSQSLMTSRRQIICYASARPGFASKRQTMRHPIPRPGIVQAMVPVPLLQRQTRVCQQAAGDDQPHHLVGAFQNAMYPGIAQVALKRILADITIAAKELQSLVTDAITHVGGKTLGHGAPSALVRTASVQLVGSLA